MPTYTFFCRRLDGSAATSSAQEHRSDEAAIAAANRLLVEHPAASEVQVFDGEREVHRCRPASAAAGAQEDALNKVQRALAAAGERAAVIVTDRYGSVVLWNGAATRLYGWTPAEAVGSPIMDMTPALQSKRRAKAIMRDLQAGKVWEGEIVLRRRDGSPFRAFVADVPLTEAEGDPGLIVGISASADARATVWEVQSKILKALQPEEPPSSR